MRIANILYNDTANGIGISVSMFVQGCHHKCRGCFNPETWDFEGGYEVKTLLFIEKLKQAISANGLVRNLSILGGEPLHPNNREDICQIISAIKKVFPQLKIFIWTGYTLQELQKEDDPALDFILMNTDYLIDGPFIQEQKDLTLWLRGSSNQNIYKLTENKNYVKIDLINGKEEVINESTSST